MTEEEIEKAANDLVRALVDPDGIRSEDAELALDILRPLVSKARDEALEEAVRLRGQVYFDFESKTINGESKRTASLVINEYVAAIRSLKSAPASPVE